jgi:hypothetical protein
MSREGALNLLSGTPTVSNIPQSSGQATTPPQGETKTETPKEPDSTAFSHLAKKEAELVREREALKAEKEETARQLEIAKKIKAEYDDYQSTKTKDPVAALKKLGFSETDIINYLAAEETREISPEEKAAKAAQDATEKRLKEFEEAQTQKQLEIQKAEDEKVIAGFKSQLGQTIAKDKEKFKYCDFYGPIAEDLAWRTVQQVVMDSKGTDILTAQEAIELVEGYYKDEDERMSKLRLPKAEPKEELPAPERTRTVTPGDPTQPVRPTITKTRTLSNTTTATVAATRHKMNETREEKKARLAERLRNGI